MAGKGLWEIPYQGIRELKRATTLRIPLKPLLAIPHVGSSAIWIFWSIVYHDSG